MSEMKIAGSSVAAGVLVLVGGTVIAAIVFTTRRTRARQIHLSRYVKCHNLFAGFGL